MVPFTPRLIPAILPNLAHHVSMIQSAAIRTNKLLLGVIQRLPSPQEPSKAAADKTSEKVTQGKVARSPTPTTTSTTTTSRQSTLSSQASSKEGSLPNANTADPSMTPRPPPPAEIPPSSATSSRPHSPVSSSSQPAASVNVNGSVPNGQLNEESDPFDYQSTVNELTIQFLSEFEETRVAALKWLIMLHQKAPKKVCGIFIF